MALPHSFWDLTGPTPGIKSGSLAVNTESCPINQVHVNAIHMGKLLPELSETTRLFRINAVFTFSWTRSLLRMCTAPGRVEEGAGDGQEAHGVAKLG